MHNNKFHWTRGVSLMAAAAAVVLLSGCSVNVQKESNGQDKQVDIKTPMGGIHVSKDAAAADTGLSVYPGARLKPEDSGHNDKSANVSISAERRSRRVCRSKRNGRPLYVRKVSYTPSPYKKPWSKTEMTACS